VPHLLVAALAAKQRKSVVVMALFWNRTPPAPHGIRVDAERSGEIDSHVASQIRAGAPGLALAVVKSAAVVHAVGYGLADLRRNVAVAPDTIFHLASCGKQFTGLGILMLAEERRLALDDPVSRHLPWLADFGPKTTIRRLLHHTSAIRDLYDEDGMEDVLARCERPSNADIIRTYADLGCPTTGNKPGEEFSYSNSGYDLLGAVIERVSGQSYHDFFQSRVFDRLGMKDTFSVPDRRVHDRRRATGYALDERGEFVEYGSSEFDDLVGSGSFYTTVSDLYLYDRALATNALVSEASMREALTSGRTNRGEWTKYGFGWYLGTYDGMAFADHEGEWIGFYSYICRYLDTPLSIFVLSNNPEIDLIAVADVATAAYR
jgi:CubicO group peptidase (beta-lactamase class C family)